MRSCSPKRNPRYQFSLARLSKASSFHFDVMGDGRKCVLEYCSHEYPFPCSGNAQCVCVHMWERGLGAREFCSPGEFFNTTVRMAGPWLIFDIMAGRVVCVGVLQPRGVSSSNSSVCQALGFFFLISKARWMLRVGILQPRRSPLLLLGGPILGSNSR